MLVLVSGSKLCFNVSNGEKAFLCKKIFLFCFSIMITDFMKTSKTLKTLLIV